MMKFTVLTALILLLSLNEAFAYGENVEMDDFLGTLGSRTALVQAANDNARESLAAAESFEQSCEYVEETLQVLNAIETGLRSKDAEKWVIHRKDALKAAAKAKGAAAKATDLCKLNDSSKADAIGKMMDAQAEALKTLAEIL